MCASPAQIAANRRNSLRSKGPTSEEGRRRSSQNAIKHGLTAHVTTVLSSEDAAAFDEQMTGVVRTLNPRNPIKGRLARQAGESAWMHDRAVRLQTARLSANIEDAEVQFPIGKRTKSACIQHSTHKALSPSLCPKS